jgi:hypothetical protein
VSSVYLFSILRAIRFPSLWSYTFYLFNYDSGFTKRGLLGEILTYLDINYLYSYQFFLILSIFLLIINSVLINIFLWKLVKSKNLWIKASAFVFASSVAVIYLGHTIGFDDQVGLLITMVMFLLKGFYKRLIWIVPAFLWVLFNHEAMLIIYYPIIFIGLLTEINPLKHWGKLTCLGMFSILVIGLTFYMSTHLLSTHEVHKMRVEIEERIGMPSRRAAYIQLHRENSATLEKNWNTWKRKGKIREYSNSLIVVLPSTLFLILVILGIQKNNFHPRTFTFLTVLAVISPQLLHIIAWDMHRWNAWSLLVSFLLLILFYQTDKESSYYYYLKHDTCMPLCLLLIFLNGSATIPLLDGYQVENFPYIKAQQAKILNVDTFQELIPKR